MFEWIDEGFTIHAIVSFTRSYIDELNQINEKGYVDMTQIESEYHFLKNEEVFKGENYEIGG